MNDNKKQYIYSVFTNYLLSGKYYSKFKKNINEDYIEYIKEKCKVIKVDYNTSYLTRVTIEGNNENVLKIINEFFDSVVGKVGAEYKSCIRITTTEISTPESNIDDVIETLKKDIKDLDKNIKDSENNDADEDDDLFDEDNPPKHNRKTEIINDDHNEEDDQDEEADDEEEDDEEEFFDTEFFSTFKNSVNNSKSTNDPDNKFPNENKKDEIYKKLDNIEGCEEFKEYIKELLKIAPIIKKRKTEKLFKNLALIISVNDGYGLSACLEVLNEVLVYIGLIDSFFRYAKEVVIEPNKDKENQLEMFSRQTYNYSKGLVCIDISNHIDKVFTNAFRNILINISKFNDKKFVVFRVPYVEKNVIDQVFKAVNDVLYCKQIVIPPFTKEQTERIAITMANEYNYTFAEDGLNIFNKKIIEEKNDGRYYGMRTIQKVVSEIIYNKILNDAVKGEEDYVIKGEDIKDILLYKELDELTGLEELDTLIGLEEVKKKTIEITNQIKATIKYQLKTRQCIHMRFVGSPGTGKTTIARIIGKILKENNVLRIGSFYEVSGRDLVGKYIGHTAPRTTEICRDAYGSVLFIDEAYTLYRSEDNGKDFGLEAIDTLIAQLENHRDDMVVIFAGYKKEMDLMMKSNPGLASRVPYEISFPNYSRETLQHILVRMVEKDGLEYDEAYLKEAENFFKKLPDSFIESREFGNARFVRNIYERSLSKAITRCELVKAPIKLTSEDFINAKSESDFAIYNDVKKIKVGFID